MAHAHDDRYYSRDNPPPSTFTGVVTTGIYCRAGCPATPLRRNTRPFEFAAAAEAAGFRPCKRCRPDTRSEPPAWTTSSELVCRALRSISDGALDVGSEDDLAAALGVSARHLRRLFDEHVGATPSEVGRSRRAHFARRLIDETDFSMSDIAFASGFGSVRQMNRVVRDVFRQAPSELRAARRRPHRFVADGGLELRLSYRPPLARRELLAFLAARAIPGVEHVDEHSYHRIIDVDGDPGVVELSFDDDAPFVLLRAHLPRLDTLLHVVTTVRRVFDLDADPTVVDRALSRDPMLRKLVKAAPGVRVPGAWNSTELGVRAILGQQVSVPAANRLAGRLVAAFGRPVPGLTPLELTHQFPTTDVLAKLDVDDLTSVGLPRSRAVAVHAFSEAVASGGLRLDAALGLDRTVAELTALPGVGPWTAHYIAMRACGEPDAFPVSDLGLRRGASTGDELVSVAELGERAEHWRPWRSYAAMRLWAQH